MVINNAGKRSLTIHFVLAFAAIYLLWGSTFLAIRVAVAAVPPLLAAGVRFSIAGGALYGWSRMRGVPAPSRREWRSLILLGGLMFLIAYSGLFWAERTIPSGLASVLVGTIPVWTALFEVFLFKTVRLRAALVLALVTGLTGVIVLVPLAGAGSVALLSCLAIFAANVSWAFGSVLTKQIALPSSKLMSAAGQMLSGGIMLLIVAGAVGECTPFPHFSLAAVGAIAYLIAAGSLGGFTAYTWLLGHLPATKVSSYAYVNPVIALALGYWLAGEPFTWRTFGGTVLVLGSVILLLANFGENRP